MLKQVYLEKKEKLVKVLETLVYVLLLFLGVILICSVQGHLNTISYPGIFTFPIQYLLLLIGFGLGIILLFLYKKNLESKLQKKGEND